MKRDILIKPGELDTEPRHPSDKLLEALASVALEAAYLEENDLQINKEK